MQKLLDRWIEKLDADQIALVEALPLRRDMVTLLNYLQDNKVKGTQALGNLPRKAIWEVSAKLVNPPVLEETFGDHTYRARSEEDVRPLNFLHVVARVGELVVGGPGRLIRVTSMGQQFLRTIPPVQVWLMLVIWWWEVDWLWAFPFSGMGEKLPRGFEKKVHQRLLTLPVGKPVEYEPFADKLITDTKLIWHAHELTHAQSLLRMSIDVMVIRMLTRFGILQSGYLNNNDGFDELVSFQVTPFGHGLLEALPKADLSNLSR